MRFSIHFQNLKTFIDTIYVVFLTFKLRITLRSVPYTAYSDITWAGMRLFVGTFRTTSSRRPAAMFKRWGTRQFTCKYLLRIDLVISTMWFGSIRVNIFFRPSNSIWSSQEVLFLPAAFKHTPLAPI